MGTWEYRVVEGSRSKSRVQDSCDKLGAEGWELVGMSPGLFAEDAGGMVGPGTVDMAWLMIFKRPGRDVA
jgi:Domain of unknown function (DUF4177)